MYLVVIAWLYVAVLMAVAEATSSTGTVLGAIITFFLYGLLPIGIVIYLMGTPLRRKARLVREQQDAALPVPGTAPPLTPSGRTPDQGGHASAAPEADGVAPVREKP